MTGTLRGSLHYYRRGASVTEDESVFTALGGSEVGLTKGLAAVLAAHPQAAVGLLQDQRFAHLVPVRHRHRLKRITSVAVDAEEVQSDGRRRDVVLRYFDDRGHVATVVIEAKSTAVTFGPISSAQLRDQLDGYLDARDTADRGAGAVVGVAVTRVPNLFRSSRIETVTWTDLVDLLEPFTAEPLVGQYRRHLMASTGLTYFQHEVLSIPAGTTIDLIRRHSIHAHPADRTPRIALYLAPRASGGGEVDTLYRISDVFDLDLDQKAVQLRRLRAEGRADLATRLAAYLRGRDRQWPGEEGVLRIYDLADRRITLSHRPRPQRNNVPDIVKWGLADFLDPSLEFLP